MSTSSRLGDGALAQCAAWASNAAAEKDMPQASQRRGAEPGDGGAARKGRASAAWASATSPSLSAHSKSA